MQHLIFEGVQTQNTTTKTHKTELKDKEKDKTILLLHKALIPSANIV